ncbi:phage head spike fiber domain-containing protein [Falsiroseomonas oryziterrae]|uniref:phage head spike fiber domain-containing protein n=1 Tax=Falsiroseomonas oryziterrae TaxID=2911368 RepID=UPI001F25763D|nr:hypothetical protein [Roseomonas sp. NPKOSM-4]
MVIAQPCLHGALAETARTLVAPGRLHPALALARSQTGSFATVLGADGANWAEAGANAARFHGASRRLLVEAARTNLIANARTPFSAGWTNSGVASAAAAAGPDGGASSAILATESTAAANHWSVPAAFAVTSGQPYATSVLVRPGTCTALQIFWPSTVAGLEAWANFVLTGAGSLGSAGTAVPRRTIRQVGAWYLCEMVATMTAAGSASPTIAFLQSATDVRAPSFTGTGRTLTLAWASCEQAASASTPVLPPAATPAASTRGADLVNVPLSALGIPPNGACTLLWSGMLPQPAPTTAAQTILTLDDGTNTNLYRVRNVAGGTSVVAGRVTAGAAADATALGSMTPGSPFRLGLAIDGAGRVAASFNGAAAVAVTGGPTAGLTTFRLGQTATAAAAMCGETAVLRALPFALGDAALAAAVASLAVP